MAYGIYLVCDQKVLFNGDYSSSNKLTGTIYSDSALTTAKSLTGYTIKIRIYKRDSDSDYFDKTANITVAASGTWNYPIAANELPGAGLYLIKLEISQSGEIMSTLNNVEILIKRGPTA